MSTHPTRTHALFILALLSLLLSACSIPTIHAAPAVFTDHLLQEIQTATLTEIPDPHLPLPTGIHPAQLKKVFQLGDLSLALIFQPSLNVPIPLPEGFQPTFTGLFVSESGTPWREYLELQSADPTANHNPYYLWADGGSLYLSIVDHLGAGSGEGHMSLMRLADTGQWDSAGCYYFGATYRGPDRDGDYFAWSSRLDRQTPAAADHCQPLTLALIQ